LGSLLLFLFNQFKHGVRPMPTVLEPVTKPAIKNQTKNICGIASIIITWKLGGDGSFVLAIALVAGALLLGMPGMALGAAKAAINRSKHEPPKNAPKENVVALRTGALSAPPDHPQEICSPQPIDAVLSRLMHRVGHILMTPVKIKRNGHSKCLI